MRERRVFPVVTLRRFFRRFNAVSRLKQSFAGFFDGRIKPGITAFRVAFFYQGFVFLRNRNLSASSNHQALEFGADKMQPIP